MQRDPRHYADAARLLWDLPPERLANLASGELTATQSVRDAAQMALGVKREFLKPEDFGSEGAALDRLAANLAMLPDFSLQEISMASGRGTIHAAPRPTEVTARPRRSRTRIVRIVLVASILLLALEALAQAGVGIVSPIGVVVDQLGGESSPDEVPDNLRSRTDPEAARSTKYEPGVPSVSARDVSRVETKGHATTKAKTKSKNENHARGRLAHYAQGREQHHAQGRDEQRRVRSKKQPPLASRVHRVVRHATRKAPRAVKSRPWPGHGRGGRSK
jgi:hypothetical protein